MIAAEEAKARPTSLNGSPVHMIGHAGGFVRSFATRKRVRPALVKKVPCGVDASRPASDLEFGSQGPTTRMGTVNVDPL